MTTILGMDRLTRAADRIKRSVENIEIRLSTLTTLSKIHAELKLANDLKVIELGRSENVAEIALIATVVEQARAEAEPSTPTDCSDYDTPF